MAKECADCGGINVHSVDCRNNPVYKDMSREDRDMLCRKASRTAVVNQPEYTDPVWASAAHGIGPEEEHLLLPSYRDR